MTDQNDPGHDERSTPDTWEDRLIDRSLRELLGDERPPDLSDKILAAAKESPQVPSQRKEKVMGKSKGNMVRRLAWATTACLVISVAIIALLPAVQADREAARRNSRQMAAREAEWAALEDAARAEAEGSSEPTRLGEVTDLGGMRYEMYEVESSHVPVPADPQAVSSGSAPAGRQSKLRMMVEPSVVISNEEKQAQPLGSEYCLEAVPIERSHVPSQVYGRRTDDVSQQPVARRSKKVADLDLGRGPGQGGDQYTRVVDNPFRKVTDHPLSTFSIDVDTAAYANVRRFLLADRRLPPPDAVRIEELVNYFDYEYAGPSDNVPFASRIEVAGCPWQPEHRLVRVGLKGKEIPQKARPKTNLVFLFDVSGSMNSDDKLPLLKEGMKLLAAELGESDRVAIVVYAGSEGLVLPSTTGDQQATIQQSLDRLESGGSTNGGAGIELAYKVARENFIEEGVNRVLLCTDGDFNVGTTSTASLERMVEQRAKSGVFLSVLGFGRGNLNDAMMENISNKGNGNYAYIDSIREAKKVLIRQMGGTLVTIAKDVKIQIEFNPARVAAYRLIGYENRILAAEDFNDDKKDAGEIGAGHTVTALYELVPAGVAVEGSSAETPPVDPLKYQKPAKPVKSDEVAEPDESIAGELLTLKLRYKRPDGDKSALLEFPVTDPGKRFGQASREMKFASAVASFGMLLRGSEHKGNATWDAVLEIATEAKGADPHGYRAELLDMVRAAKQLSASE